MDFAWNDHDVNARFVKLRKRLAHQMQEEHRSVCVFCKRVSTDGSHWREADVFPLDAPTTAIQKTIRPECSQKRYPKLYR